MMPGRWLPVLAGLVTTTALLGVFLLYTQPDFLRDLADQLWACF